MFGHMTPVGLASFSLRLGLAAIFLYHGALHVLYHPAQWHPSLHAGIQVAVSFGEIICGAAMLLGLFSRVAAVGVIIIMVGAVCSEFGKIGFAQLDIDSAHKDAGHTAFGTIVPGVEFNIALIAMAVAVLLVGSGPLSLDYRLSRRDGAGATGTQPATTSS